MLLQSQENVFVCQPFMLPDFSSSVTSFNSFLNFRILRNINTTTINRTTQPIIFPIKLPDDPIRKTSQNNVMLLIKAAIESNKIKFKNLSLTKPDVIKRIFLKPNGISLKVMNVKKPCSVLYILHGLSSY